MEAAEAGGAPRNNLRDIIKETDKVYYKGESGRKEQRRQKESEEREKRDKRQEHRHIKILATVVE